MSEASYIDKFIKDRKGQQLEELKQKLALAEQAKENHKNFWSSEQNEEWTNQEIIEKRKELLFVFQLLEYMDKADLGVISKTLGGTGVLGEAKLKWSLRVRAAYLIGFLNKCADVTQKKMDLNRFLEENKDRGA